MFSKIPPSSTASTSATTPLPSNDAAKMVHLGRVQTDKDLSERIIPGLEEIKFDSPGADEFTASVYGSRFAATDIPKHEMPEEEMPKEIAYRLIKYEQETIMRICSL